MKKSNYNEETMPFINYAPSAPPMISPMQISPMGIAPEEIIIESSTGVVPDRVVKQQVEALVQRSKVDGDRIVHHDKLAVHSSNSAAQHIQRDVGRRVAGSTWDRVDDLTVRPVPVAQPLGANPLSQSKGQAQSKEEGKGYQMSEYKSVYEGGNSSGYQMSEYKSMYE